MENKDIARFLYEQRIQNEKPIENPDGESLALLELFEDGSQKTNGNKK